MKKTKRGRRASREVEEIIIIKPNIAISIITVWLVFIEEITRTIEQIEEYEELNK